MLLARRRFLEAGASVAAFPRLAAAEAKPPIRVGIVTDMNGPFADFAGPGAVIAGRLAAEEFADGVLGRPVQILAGDHQTKPDIASTIARDWIDTHGVSAIAECGHSGSALALQKLTRDKNRVFMVTGASTSDLTNQACSPLGFHFKL
jgi:branched-chain amino acid transport system substrate-binding protein